MSEVKGQQLYEKEEMDKTVKDTESIDAIAAYKKQSSDHIKRMSRTAPPAAIQAPERQHLATKGKFTTMLFSCLAIKP